MTPNLSAFLWVLRHCEGTAGPNGYRMHFGGQLFDSFADHPRVVIERGRYRSTAAGAYQILSRTWDWFISRNGPHDFSPDNQDLCARWLITQRKAMGDVEAGRFNDAIAKCAKEWASLPGSPYGQPVRTIEYCRRVYVEHGGAFVQDSPVFTEHEQPQPLNEITQPIEQIEESSQNVATNPVPELGTPVPEVGTPTEKPVGPFLAFLPSILQMIPQLAAVFRPGDENIAKGVEAAKIVTNVLTQSTGAVNLQDAVEKMQADPTVARSAAAAVLTQPEISVLIVEHGSGGVTGARDFLSANANNPQMVSIIRTVSYWALMFLTFANVAGFALASFLIYKDRDEWQQIVSTLIQADIAATMIALGFWLGATMAKSSATGNSQR